MGISKQAGQRKATKNSLKYKIGWKRQIGRPKTPETEEELLQLKLTLARRQVKKQSIEGDGQKE